MRRDLISKVMREMGRKGGKAAKGKGVKARMAALTPEQRKELARKAAQARWSRAKEKGKSPTKGKNR
jgi:Spy/CpxP family protein refolding chaperone